MTTNNIIYSLYLARKNPKAVIILNLYTLNQPILSHEAPVMVMSIQHMLASRNKGRRFRLDTISSHLRIKLATTIIIKTDTINRIFPKLIQSQYKTQISFWIWTNTLCLQTTNKITCIRTTNLFVYHHAQPTEIVSVSICFRWIILRIIRSNSNIRSLKNTLSLNSKSTVRIKTRTMGISSLGINDFHDDFI
jgi:hypothetical protein